MKTGIYRKWPVVVLLALSLFVSCGLSHGRGDIYKYVDDDGVIHFSNVPSDSRYRLYIRAPVKDAASFANDYEDIITRASESFGVDSALIKAVIKAESDFDHMAVSEKGAQGLMQLMPHTAEMMAVGDPFDPEANILGGTRYLGSLLERFNGDHRLALAAYNAGPGRVEAHRDVPPFEETRVFVDRVLKYLKQFELPAGFER